MERKNYYIPCFDDCPSEYSQNTEDSEYIPIQTSETNRPPSPDLQQLWWSKVEKTTERGENDERKVPQQISEDDQNTQKKLKKIQKVHQKMMFKNPQKFLATRNHKYS